MCSKPHHPTNWVHNWPKNPFCKKPMHHFSSWLAWSLGTKRKCTAIFSAFYRILPHFTTILAQFFRACGTAPPPPPDAQVFNLANSHLVLRLLIAPALENLCLKFGPLCDNPHMVGANMEELFWSSLPSKKAFNHCSRRSGRFFFVLLVLLLLQLHVHFPPSSSTDGLSFHPAF